MSVFSVETDFAIAAIILAVVTVLWWIHFLWKEWDKKRRELPPDWRPYIEAVRYMDELVLRTLSRATE